MGSEYNESFVQKILSGTQESLDYWEKRIREKSKPHWWSLSKEPENSDVQRCEDLRRTLVYVQSWRSRLTAPPKFPANGGYSADIRQTAIAALQKELADVERETAPANVLLTYSRRRYETNENGGGGPGRWVADASGNYFVELKQRLVEKLQEEIRSLDLTQQTPQQAKEPERTTSSASSRSIPSGRRSGNCPVCGADPDESHRGH